MSARELQAQNEVSYRLAEFKLAKWLHRFGQATGIDVLRARDRYIDALLAAAMATPPKEEA